MIPLAFQVQNSVGNSILDSKTILRVFVKKMFGELSLVPLTSMIMTMLNGTN